MANQLTLREGEESQVFQTSIHLKSSLNRMYKTIIKFYAKSKVYCDWYKCQECGADKIMDFFEYCPKCGRKIIIKKLPIKQATSKKYPQRAKKKAKQTITIQYR